MQVKKAAVEIVSGLTGSEEGLQSLSKYSEILLPSLSRLLSESKVLLIIYNPKKAFFLDLDYYYL